MMASDTRLSAMTAGLFPVISDEVVSICSSKHLRSTLPQSGTGLLTGPTTSFNSSFTPCVSGSGLGCLERIYFDSQPCPILQSSGQSHGKLGIRWWKAAPSESSLWHRSFCLFSSFIISQHHILLRSRDVASCGAASLGYNDADSGTIEKSASTTIHGYTLIVNRWRNVLCRQQKSIDGHRCVIESILQRLLPWGPRWQKQFKSMTALHIRSFWINEASSNGANENASALFQAHGLTVLCAMLNSIWSLAFGIADLTHGQAVYAQGRLWGIPCFVAVQMDFSERFPRCQHFLRCGRCREDQVQTKTSEVLFCWTEMSNKTWKL